MVRIRSTLSAIAAEARFVSDRREFWQVVGQPTFLIRFPEKFRVGEARTQDALVPRSHVPLRIAGKVDDREKMRS